MENIKYVCSLASSFALISIIPLPRCEAIFRIDSLHHRYNRAIYDEYVRVIYLNNEKPTTSNQQSGSGLDRSLALLRSHVCAHVHVN